MELPKAKDIKQIPKDVTAKAIIIDLELTTWKDLTKDEERKKTASEKPALKITYDASGFIRHDVFGLPDTLTNASNYGRFVEKYNIDEDPEFEPKVGMEIKVLFDSDGNSDIIIAK